MTEQDDRIQENEPTETASIDISGHQGIDCNSCTRRVCEFFYRFPDKCDAICHLRYTIHFIGYAIVSISIHTIATPDFDEFEMKHNKLQSIHKSTKHKH